MMMTLGRPGLLMVCAWTITALRAQTQASQKMNRVGFITIIHQFLEEELQPELQLRFDPPAPATPNPLAPSVLPSALSPKMSRGPLSAVTPKGEPLCNVAIVESDQPPKARFRNPSRNQRLPFPNGNS